MTSGQQCSAVEKSPAEQLWCCTSPCQRLALLLSQLWQFAPVLHERCASDLLPFIKKCTCWCRRRQLLLPFLFSLQLSLDHRLRAPFRNVRVATGALVVYRLPAADPWNCHMGLAGGGSCGSWGRGRACWLLRLDACVARAQLLAIQLASPVASVQVEQRTTCSALSAHQHSVSQLCGGALLTLQQLQLSTFRSRSLCL